MAETEEEERRVEHNFNNVTMDNICQSPITTNTRRRNTNIPNERRVSLDILEERIKVFNGLALHSTINNSAYYDSDEYDAESDPKIDQLVSTHTSNVKKRKVAYTDPNNRNYPHNLLINRLIPEIVPVIIPPINPPIEDCGWV